MVNNGAIKEKYYYPMLVSYQAGVEDSEDVFLKKWSEFDNLSESYKDILTSRDIVVNIKNVCDQYNFNVEQSSEFTRIVRDIFFGKISRGNMAETISRRINSIDSGKVQAIANIVRDKILNAAPGEKLEKPRNVVRLSLSQAMKEYPKLESQQVTNDFLKLRYSEFPSRPTIKNWITDYYQNLGVGGHGIMERGNFLFHSDNCKKLTSVERQKLALVFKSLSENMPLVIDTEKQQIIFPEVSQNVERVNQSSAFPLLDKSRNSSKPSFSQDANLKPKIDQSSAPSFSQNKGEIKFFSGQDMKPSPPMAQNVERVTSNAEHETLNVERVTQNVEQPSNADNLHFSSPQKLPAEKEKQEIGDATLKIYPRRFANDSGNNDNAKMQDVRISGNVVDLKNKN